MNTQYVKESNPVIAKFMGLRFKQHGYPLPYWLEGKRRINHLFYHDSWDWLMPVFEKIQQLEPNVPGLYTVRTARIGRGTAYIEIHTTNEGWETKSHTFHASSEITINALYRVCIDFIKYYNTIQPHPLRISVEE